MGQPPLQGAECALASTTSLRRVGPDLADAQRLECARHRALLNLIGTIFGNLCIAEVAAAVGVKLAESTVTAQDVLESIERRDHALLLEKARVENLAGRVVEHDDQVVIR